MGTVKNTTKDLKKSSSKTGEHLKISEIIWVSIWAILIIGIWYYSGKDYEGETINKNSSVTDNQ